MSLLRPEIRARLYLRVKNLGGKREATEVESDGIIDPTPFRRSEAADGDFQGALIYRPNVATIDQIREAGLIDGNKLLQTGDAYTDLTDLDYELGFQLHPYVINDCVRLAPREIYGEVSVPLTLWPDGDFSDSGVTKWNNGAIAAPTKSSDTQYKFVGNQRTLVVAASGGNLYAQSEDVMVEPGDQIFHAAIGAVERSSSGTAYYALWDQTNNVALYSTTFASYRDQIVKRTDTIPATCYKIAIRLGATANSCTTVWKAVPSHRLGSGTTEVQSWLKEQVNLLGFGPAFYGRSTGTDRFNATDRVLEGWTDENGRDFQLMPLVSASDFYSLQVNRSGGLLAEDYWIHGYRRMSDIEEELDDEAAASNIDEEMLLTAVECLVTAQLGPEYAEQYSRCKSKLLAQRVARARIIQPKRGHRIVMVGLRGR